MEVDADGTLWRFDRLEGFNNIEIVKSGLKYIRKTNNVLIRNVLTNES